MGREELVRPAWLVTGTVKASEAAYLVADVRVDLLGKRAEC
jgi:hypothetical protein